MPRSRPSRGHGFGGRRVEHLVVRRQLRLVVERLRRRHRHQQRRHDRRRSDHPQPDHGDGGRSHRQGRAGRQHRRDRRHDRRGLGRPDRDRRVQRRRLEVAEPAVQPARLAPRRARARRRGERRGPRTCLGDRHRLASRRVGRHLRDRDLGDRHHGRRRQREHRRGGRQLLFPGVDSPAPGADSYGAEGAAGGLLFATNKASSAARAEIVFTTASAGSVDSGRDRDLRLRRCDRRRAEHDRAGRRHRQQPLGHHRDRRAVAHRGRLPVHGGLGHPHAQSRTTACSPTPTATSTSTRARPVP